MRQSGPFSRQASCSFRQLSDGERVCSFLRKTHPEKTAANVAADTGISVRTIEKWLERLSAPSWAHGVRLLATYGPEFMCAVMDAPPAWLDQAARKERRTRVTAMRDELSRLLEHEEA